MNGDLPAFSAYLDGTLLTRLRGMSKNDLIAELLLMHRTIKVVEEVGEVVGALIGVTGANPRKGLSHTRVDLVKELHDVAVSVEGAVEHVQGNTGRALDGLDVAVAAVYRRAGLPEVHSSVGSFTRADCRCPIGRDHPMGEVAPLPEVTQ